MYYAICQKPEPLSWKDIPAAPLTHVHPESSTHHPLVEARLTADDTHLYVRFDVEDQYVLARSTDYQDPVYTDSCVEFFVQPKPDHGYFNFEMNALGTLLLTYIEDARRLPEGGFATYQVVPEELGRRVVMRSSIDKPVTTEIHEQLNWWLEVDIPFAFLEHYVGKLPESGKREFRGNFYKCADDSSHPHWLSWAPIGEELNFHVPEYFVPLIFVE